LSTLFLTNEKTEIQEAKLLLEQFTLINGSPEYWGCSGTLLNLLTSKFGGGHGDSIDKLLVAIKEATPKQIDFDSLLRFLLSNPTLNHLLEAEKYWILAMQSGWLADKKSWVYAKQILFPLLECADSEVEYSVSRILQVIFDRYGEFEKNLGTSFNAEVLYFNIKQWHHLGNKIESELLFRKLLNDIGIIIQYYPYEERLLSALATALTAIFPVEKAEFFLFLDAFWNLIAIQTKQNRKEKNRILLAEEKCFALKDKLVKDIEALLANSSNPDLNEKVAHYERKLQQEFPHRFAQKESLK